MVSVFLKTCNFGSSFLILSFSRQLMRSPLNVSVTKGHLNLKCLKNSYRINFILSFTMLQKFISIYYKVRTHIPLKLNTHKQKVLQNVKLIFHIRIFARTMSLSVLTSQTSTSSIFMFYHCAIPSWGLLNRMGSWKNPVPGEAMAAQKLPLLLVAIDLEYI